MGWSYIELLALDADIYDELKQMVRESETTPPGAGW